MHKNTENIRDIDGADILADFGITEQGIEWYNAHRKAGAITQTMSRRREG